MLRNGLAAFASATYRTGGIDPTVLLVASEDPEEFLASSSSLARLTDRSAASLRTVIAERSQLQQDNALVGEQLADLAEAKAEVERQKNEIDAKLAQAQQVLNTLKEEERQRVLAAQRAARDRDQAAADAARAAKPAAEKPTYTGSASGPAAWPSRTTSSVTGTSTAPPAPTPGTARAHAGRLGGRGRVAAALSSAQYSSGRKVAKSELQPGDLVFFYSPISHVGIYIGDGNMIHASNPSKPVAIAPIDYIPTRGPFAPSWPEGDTAA